MTYLRQNAKLLVLRVEMPTHAIQASAFAHVRLHGASGIGGHVIETTDNIDYETVTKESPRDISLEDFALHGQIDERSPMPYEITYGYKPDNYREVITYGRSEKHHSDLRRLKQRMDDFFKIDGPEIFFGGTVWRLARSLNADALVLLSSENAAVKEVMTIPGHAAEIHRIANTAAYEAHVRCATLAHCEPVPMPQGWNVY